MKVFTGRGARTLGKYFAILMKLKIDLEDGIDCGIRTCNAEKTKRDFEYFTGSNIKLTKVEDNIYRAKLTD